MTYEQIKDLVDNPDKVNISRLTQIENIYLSIAIYRNGVSNAKWFDMTAKFLEACVNKPNQKITYAIEWERRTKSEILDKDGMDLIAMKLVIEQIEQWIGSEEK